MSPVGSYESLMAAIQGGADAVYFGIGHLNMRSASSKNFTLDDLKEISSICGENNVRSYITLNTVVYDEEIKEMKKVVEAANDNNISAIIASDMSVISYARQTGMEVHISTQTNISNIEAVKFYSQFADVMVTARELSLDKVKAITQAIEKEQVKGPSGNLIQIEIFAHGALCMAISGKCYLSLDNLNHSANRGECLQLCRRPYKVTDKDGKVELEVDNEYIMSPKDLKTLDFLDKILAAGVKVLKIEGRGRSPEYVKTVTECYKEAVEAYFKGEYTEENIGKWNEKLKTVYNRGFWDGYYLGRKLGEWADRYGSQATKKKIYVGKVTNYYTKLKVAEVKMETQSLHVGDEIKIIGPTTGVVDEKVKEIRVDLKKVKKTDKGDFCSIPVKTFLRRSDKVYKIVDANS
ncbi:MAG: U32 family peptidase [Bacteroidales bacterium]|nr:U32 family peptidase [Bacteroidales bacterium]MCF8386233.1 U32 family peptidase [Bacteroidales bacterium]MCF8397486.1 U32 family peptidase [Bacteroidales bacterium]